MRRQRTFIGPQGMAGMVGLWGASSLIESIQSGTVTTSGTGGTATITAVDTARSVLLMLGQKTDTAGPNPSGFNSYIVLTNSTTVTATTAASGVKIISFVVIQFAPGVIRSIQRGTISNSATTATATITEVNTAKSFVSYLGFSTTVADDRAACRLTLTNGTTVTSARDASATGTTVTSYEAVEFF